VFRQNEGFERVVEGCGRFVRSEESSWVIAFSGGKFGKKSVKRSTDFLGVETGWS
jgi:hypothetical protein